MPVGALSGQILAVVSPIGGRSLAAMGQQQEHQIEFCASEYNASLLLSALGTAPSQGPALQDFENCWTGYITKAISSTPTSNYFLRPKNVNLVSPEVKQY